MPKVYDVVKAAGTYQNADGEEKTRWINCGMIVQNPESGRMSLKLDCLPIGTPTDGDVGVWFALMEPRSRQQKPQRRSRAPAQNAPDLPDEDVPF